MSTDLSPNEVAVVLLATIAVIAGVFAFLGWLAEVFDKYFPRDW